MRRIGLYLPRDVEIVEGRTLRHLHQRELPGFVDVDLRRFAGGHHSGRTRRRLGGFATGGILVGTATGPQQQHQQCQSRWATQ